MTDRHTQAGITLIEVLVTMVILGVGLLGLGALQALTLKHNLVALQRSYATFHAHDIIESMRANLQQRDGYRTGFTDEPNGTALSSADLQYWKQGLAKHLPSGEGRITFDGDLVEVAIRWYETQLPADPDGEPTLEWVQFETQALLPKPESKTTL
ncbi:type IV pilus modification protein PilV [Marichromatium bheemlicum]|uniref:Type IV pilus modification protein PilV n=1 Tax=Marichromatium bheemlicum TaxID=365339 RepID=A0ABX1I3H7_9GAMM|nr:type IV pilus modification protein PilV [Marichromatium bheemlicum]NKN31668.1 type IV pilus modification protein PilV [Marichromatium bheemlicum]